MTRFIRQEFAPDLSDTFLALKKTGNGNSIAGTEGCQILLELDQHPQSQLL